MENTYYDNSIFQARAIYHYLRLRKGHEYVSDLVNSFNEDAPAILDYLRCLAIGKAENGTHGLAWAVVDYESMDYNEQPRVVDHFDSEAEASAYLDSLRDKEGDLPQPYTLFEVEQRYI